MDWEEAEEAEGAKAGEDAAVADDEAEGVAPVGAAEAVEGRALEGADVEADGNDSIAALWFPLP